MQYLALRYILSAVFATAMSFYIVPLMSKIALKWRILDVPDGMIKNHSRPVPYLGGIAIYASLIATLALFYPMHTKTLWLLLGVTFLLLVGLVDDLIVLRPFQKFTGQCVAITCFLKGGMALRTEFFSTFFNGFLSAFWMLLMTNAFNLIDVMDGLAASQAVIVGMGFLSVVFLFGHHAIGLLLVAFIGAVFGFFLHNKPNARIYLGDCGALFLGGFFAALPFLFSWGSVHPFGFFVPLAFLAVPLLEVGGLIVVRSVLRIPPYQGSPHHFSIYLQNKGWSKWRVMLFTTAITLCAIVASLTFLIGIISIESLVVLALGCVALWIFIVFS